MAIALFKTTIVLNLLLLVESQQTCVSPSPNGDVTVQCLYPGGRIEILYVSVNDCTSSTCCNGGPASSEDIHPDYTTLFNETCNGRSLCTVDNGQLIMHGEGSIVVRYTCGQTTKEVTECHIRKFTDQLCSGATKIEVTDAVFGVSSCVPLGSNLNCCHQFDDCLISVKGTWPEYYQNITSKCNGKQQCESLSADWIDHVDKYCDSFTGLSDYVTIHYVCLTESQRLTTPAQDVSSQTTPQRPSVSNTAQTPSQSPVSGAAEGSPQSPSEGATSSDVTYPVDGEQIYQDNVQLGLIIGLVIALLAFLAPATAVGVIYIKRKRKAAASSNDVIHTSDNARDVTASVDYSALGHVTSQDDVYTALEGKSGDETNGHAGNHQVYENNAMTHDYENTNKMTTESDLSARLVPYQNVTIGDASRGRPVRGIREQHESSGSASGPYQTGALSLEDQDYVNTAQASA